MLDKQDILKFLSKNKEQLQNKFYLEKIGLFGSFSRNEQTEESDIDLLILYKEGTPKLYSVEEDFRKLISSKFDRKVDICSEKWIKPVFKPLIMKDVIYV